MNNRFYPNNRPFFFRLLSLFVVFMFAFCLVIPSGVAQQTRIYLPAPGSMVSPSPSFVPPLLKGITVYPQNPLHLDFIVDSGQKDYSQEQLMEESRRLIRYFLTSLTVPEQDVWVNLSPYESDRIISEALGQTELGEDLLAMDYLLKQLTASLMYPEEELGALFWERIYQKAAEAYGTTEIPIDTFHKVWILPQEAEVYVYQNTAYITKSRLKVMLEEDYLAMTKNTAMRHRFQDKITREIILPEIEKEINEGAHFARLRQIYHALILAKWYKKTVRQSLLSALYIDQNKMAGLKKGRADIKEKIYARYMKAFKRGVFNYIKEEPLEHSKEIVPRKYFSGGFKGKLQLQHSTSPIKGNGFLGKGMVLVVLLGAVSSADMVAYGEALVSSDTEGQKVFEVNPVQRELSDKRIGSYAYRQAIAYMARSPEYHQALIPFLKNILEEKNIMLSVRLQASRILKALGEKDVTLDFRHLMEDFIGKISSVGENKTIQEYLNEALRSHQQDVVSLALNIIRETSFYDKDTLRLMRQILFRYDELFFEALSALEAAGKQAASYMRLDEDPNAPQWARQEVHDALKRLDDGFSEFSREQSKAFEGDSLGGIDLKSVDLKRQGAIERIIQFDPQVMASFLHKNMEGLSPTVIHTFSIQSILPLLGLSQLQPEEDLDREALLN